MFIRSLKHVISSWRHHSTLQFTTVLVLTACLTITNVAVLFSKNLQSILTLWGENIDVSVYLKDGITEGDVANVENALKSLGPSLGKLEFISKEKALKSFQEQMAGYAQGVSVDEQLLEMIPASFEFALSSAIPSGRQISFIEEVSSKLKSLPAVEQVSYGQDWVKNYSALIMTTKNISWALIAILLVAVGFVTSNSLKNSLEQRRGEVEVLELIGASRGFVQIPYIVEGASMAFIAVSFSFLTSYTVYSSLKEVIRTKISFVQLAQRMDFLSPIQVILFILLATALGALSAFMCVRKINSGWAATQKWNHG